MKKAKMLSLTACLVLAMAFTFSCSSDDGGGGNTCSANLKTTRIGSQTWMAENLNCGVKGSKCYDDDPANCKKYGRLYDWATAKTACPSGWHLPTDAEWTTLIDYAGGRSNAGKKLKARSGWDEGGNGTDDYGFSALPGGFGKSNGYFGSVGETGFWWSASEDDSYDAYQWAMDYSDNSAHWDYDDKSLLLSVRCVQD